MPETNILLESGTNELEIVEFYLEEQREKGTYRGFYGINVAKVLEILQLPKLTDMPEAAHPAVLGAFNLRNEIIPRITSYNVCYTKLLRTSWGATGSPPCPWTPR